MPACSSSFDVSTCVWSDVHTIAASTCMLASCNIFPMEVKKGHWYAEATQAAGWCESTMHTRNAEELARTAEAWL